MGRTLKAKRRADRKGKQAVITGGLILILAVGGVFISIYVLRGPGPVPKSQDEPQGQTKQEQTAVEETPASGVSLYYLGTVTIMESQTSYNAVGGTMQTASDVTCVSEELLVFDEKTQKLYIMGRFLTFEGTMEAAGDPGERWLPASAAAITANPLKNTAAAECWIKQAI